VKIQAWNLTTGAVIGIGEDEKGFEIEGTVTHVVPCMLERLPSVMVSLDGYYYPIIIDADREIQLRNE